MERFMMPSTRLKNHFVPPADADSTATPGPGRNEDMALFLTLTQHPKASSDTALHKLLPFIDVLPDLLREVNLTRKIRLNPWERKSARTTGSKRSEKFSILYDTQIEENGRKNLRPIFVKAKAASAHAILFGKGIDM
eukprot:scaffold34924_cov125-Amphora_coffeaeformis.AAC.5